MLTFQEMIRRLCDYWIEQGCTLHQGVDVEVGAGTFNESTFLRALGPEPYCAVNVEPCRRPTDARYGQNPNRCHLFHQLQVVMKPHPENFQELFLKSLETIGIRLEEHDLRFVHDDWESPTLGAWGLGWEVWLDGMEVTQYTYFQSVAGHEMFPVMGELAYGLERLAMYVQGVSNIYDIQYSDTLTLGEISKRAELEWSHYNFEHSDVALWQRHFEDYEKEALSLCEKDFPIPAYNFVMKASHAFNMLDARGAISVTARKDYILRIRNLACRVADAYVKTREEIGFPLGAHEMSASPLIAFDTQSTRVPKNRTEDFIFEINSEELPANAVPVGMQGLKEAFVRWAKEHGVGYEAIEVYGTPRRLAVSIAKLQTEVADQQEVRKGPPVLVCFDESGSLTKQGEGFFKSIGKEPCNLQEIQKSNQSGIEIKELKGKEYLFAHLVKKGELTANLLKRFLPQCVLDLHFPKKMRASDKRFSYPRPIRSLVAMLGEDIVDFTLDGIQASNTTDGHRQLSPKKVILSHASTYLNALRDVHVLACVEERRARIEEQLERIEKEEGLHAISKQSVIDEVIHLSEYPMLAVESFDPKYLDMPREITISEMVEHQKYFAMETSEHQLASRFVITADNRVNDLIRKGNRAVITARLDDGYFFYRQDLKTPLMEFQEKLKEVTFHKKLGSVFDKTVRMEAVCDLLVEALSKKEQREALIKACLLCKADLSSLLVGEFPDLQGIIGSYYAANAHESSEVVDGIRDHYMPIAELAPLPTSDVGAMLSIADKLDSMVSYYSIGLVPSSSSDPFALRRQAFGILRILIDRQWDLDLKDLVEKMQPALDPKRREELFEFFRGRMRSLMLQEGFEKEEVEATLSSQKIRPYDLYLLTKALHQIRAKSAEFKELSTVYKRAVGQLDPAAQYALKPDALSEEAELVLYQAIQRLHPEFKRLCSQREYVPAFEILIEYKKPLERFFDEVQVLVDDPEVRSNRLALLESVARDFTHLLNFKEL